MKIENTGSVVDLDVKRCYLPIVITDTCPKCGVTVQKHLEGDYISYPKVNKPFTISMHHIIEHPDHEDNAPETTPIRIGASIPVSLIRRDYQESGLVKALETGRGCFDPGTITDGQITAIAREEATLRGYSDVGITYHDEPCSTCKGKGKFQRYPLTLNTREQIEAFQRSSGIWVDGIIGPETRAAIERSKNAGPLKACPTCEGDGFAPPMAEMPWRKAKAAEVKP